MWVSLPYFLAQLIGKGTNSAAPPDLYWACFPCPSFINMYMQARTVLTTFHSYIHTRKHMFMCCIAMQLWAWEPLSLCLFSPLSDYGGMFYCSTHNSALSYPCRKCLPRDVVLLWRDVILLYFTLLYLYTYVQVRALSQQYRLILVIMHIHKAHSMNIQARVNPDMFHNDARTCSYVILWIYRLAYSPTPRRCCCMCYPQHVSLWCAHILMCHSHAYTGSHIPQHQGGAAICWLPRQAAGIGSRGKRGWCIMSVCVCTLKTAAAHPA